MARKSASTRKWAIATDTLTGKTSPVHCSIGAVRNDDLPSSWDKGEHRLCGSKLTKPMDTGHYR
jgi:hypothetical protein